MVSFYIDDTKKSKLLPLCVHLGKRLGMRGNDETIFRFTRKYAAFHNSRTKITDICVEEGLANLVLINLRACVREFKGKTPTLLEAEVQAGNVRSMVLLSDVYHFGLLGCAQNLPRANDLSYEACLTKDPFGCAHQASCILATLNFDPPIIPRHDQARYRKNFFQLCELCALKSYICPAVLAADQQETFKPTDFPAITQVLVERLCHSEEEKLSNKSAATASSSPKESAASASSSPKESAATASSSSSNLLQCSYSVCAKVVQNESQLRLCGFCRQASYCSKGEKNSGVALKLIVITFSVKQNGTQTLTLSCSCVFIPDFFAGGHICCVQSVKKKIGRTATSAPALASGIQKREQSVLVAATWSYQVAISVPNGSTK